MKKLLLLFFFAGSLQAQELKYTVDLRNYRIQVALETTLSEEPYQDLEIPAWSPGYYQIMDFGKQVRHFEAKDSQGEILRHVKFGENRWRVYTGKSTSLKVNYEIEANRNFVGTAFIDSSRAFLKPAAVFMHFTGKLFTPVKIEILPPSAWDRLATGLEPIGKKENSLFAPDVDILYDSPILVGPLTELPAFQVGGKKHRFLGYGMGELDGVALMKDLKRLITTATTLMGDIPYPHYTFIGLGPGNGGIEQLNSTAVAFTGKDLNGPGRNRTLRFLTHEYFHHYNAKRIRPIELGPFDYSGPNRTNLLWVAEGLTSYYENIIMNRAGLLSAEEMREAWSSAIARFQKNPGRFNQTLAESSAKTWEDGPFGKKGETISYYEKGPLVGMLLDIEIRVSSSNKKSLDDVMRHLYHQIYKKENRGFTDSEFREICEKMAGRSLQEIFDYVYTTKELNYPAHFRKIGIDMDANYSMTIRPDRTELQKKIANDLFR
jgi:predicted metalloprotease with PDZ domain